MSHWMQIKSGMHYVKNYGLRRKLTKSVNFNYLFSPNYFYMILSSTRLNIDCPPDTTLLTNFPNKF